MKIKYKKSISDVIILIVMLLCVAITIIVSLYVGIEIKTKLIPVISSMGGGTEATTALNQMIAIATNSADWLVFICFIIGILGIIVTSFLFYVHPVFSVLYILLILGVNIVSVLISNLYSEFISSPIFSSVVGLFPVTNWIMRFLPILTLAISALSIIVIYAKPNLNSGRGLGV